MFLLGWQRGGGNFALHLLGASTLCYLVSSSLQPEDEGKTLHGFTGKAIKDLS